MSILLKSPQKKKERERKRGVGGEEGAPINFQKARNQEKVIKFQNIYTAQGFSGF